ncbi:hypothetical protein C7293_08680 [filamentous cyanobacterium CCT1]|nr:hypothetical protein C7293_08680 [filamentous cyanobacterium CCT1]PSN81098.1 hypothetical protein C8B47_03100 [filamentous cyanobacterium CCP4]
MTLFIENKNKFGIVAANHTGYVEDIFKCLESGNIAVPLKTVNDFDRVAAANVNEVITPTVGDNWMRRKFTPSNSKTAALIAFTSGTEGAPKGVILTHENLADVVSRLNSLMQIDDSISEYIGVPVYHSFGFGRCRAVSAVGGQFFIPSNGFNPSEIGEMLRNNQINAISAVPSLWRVLLANKDLIGSYGKRVQWIEIGSQYMSRHEKEALKGLFPEARIVQHYGLTEASRTTLLEIHNAEGNALESVGQAFGNVEIKLNSEGQILIRGEHVAQSYLINGKAISLQDEAGWFLTKDLGSLERGYLYYRGRADDVINCGGLKVNPETLETKIYETLGLSTGLAICRKADPMRGESFLVAVTREVDLEKQQLQVTVSKAVQELGVNAANAIAIVDVDSLPKTATGKVQRKQLEEWYVQEFLPNNQPATVSLDVPQGSVSHRSTIQTIFCQSLNLQQINPQDTFISLGGDSLSYVQLSMDLERYLGYLPNQWEQTPLIKLDQLLPQSGASTFVETDIALRAFAITGIISNHAGLHFVKGGAFLLLLIAGLNFSRFQGHSLLNGRFQSIFSSLKHLAIPYLILVVSYQTWKQSFDPLIIGFAGNFQIPELQTKNAIFFVWFVANLMQTVVLFSLPFAIKRVREFASLSPWLFGILLLGISSVTRLFGPMLWDTSYLYDQVPHMLFWVFTLGWCIHFSKSRLEKGFTTVALLTLTPLFLGFSNSQTWWITTGGSMLLWAPYLPIPTQVKGPIQTVSAASYYIYLTYMIFIHLVTNVGKISNPLAIIVITLVGGTLVWSGIQFFKRVLAERWFSKLGNKAPNNSEIF